MRKPARNSGVILVAVLVCLAVVMTVTASTLQASLRMRQEVRTHKSRLQAELFCDAGMIRAERKLLEDSKYQGESWKPELAELPDLDIRIDIRFQEPVGNGNMKEILVTAQVVGLGTDNSKSIQVTKKREKQ